MRVALISPYHGGSHAAWAEGLVAHSRHRIELLPLPARFWKWRMHGAAVTLARQLRRLPRFDLLLATDMLDLTTLLALTRRRTAQTPTVLYLHENQLTYPLPEDGDTGPMRRQRGERDRHYGFINFVSMLAADRIVFNSEYHRQEVLAELPRFLGHFPEYREQDTIEIIASRSCVIPIGIESAGTSAPAERTLAPLIVWNQRWEYDKNPAAFFKALVRMADDGLDFRVALCGERFGRQPSAFERGRAALGDRVEHQGYLERDEYLRLLGRASIVISTSEHEFFGIAILEAICAGAFPLLPDRLSYPEILPSSAHRSCLYDGQDDLEAKLRAALSEPRTIAGPASDLAISMRNRFSWPAVVGHYDRLFEALAAAGSTGCGDGEI